MRLVMGLAMLACAAAATAQAPEDRWIEGDWAGEVVTPFDDMPRHRLRMNIGLERSGEPTATLRYETLNCSAIWTDGEREGRGWRFRELDTEDPGDNCPAEMSVLVTRANGGMTVRWSEPGGGRALADATLRRTR